MKTRRTLESEQNNHRRTQSILPNAKSSTADWENNIEETRAKNAAGLLKRSEEKVTELQSANHSLRISVSHENCVRKKSVEKLFEWVHWLFNDYYRKNRQAAGGVRVRDGLERGKDGKWYIDVYEEE